MSGAVLAMLVGMVGFAVLGAFTEPTLIRVVCGLLAAVCGMLAGALLGLNET